MLDSESSDDEEETGLKYQKKKHRAREINVQAALQPIFYVRYLKLADFVSNEYFQ
jgi:hypothetical protein